ncbi:MAG: LysE family translocator [Pseudomonadota bacterium]
MAGGLDIASFAVFAASQVGTPGPANMVLLTAGARYGLRAALPFVAGVVVSKQLVIWPLGFGLLALGAQSPVIFEVLRWGSAAYILYLAWRIAGSRIVPGEVGSAPGFFSGLVVHPLNPKAWAMITVGFTQFASPGAPDWEVAASIAGVLLILQLVLHPIWCWGGERIAAAIADTPAERWLMRGLALLTVASVAWVLAKGG